MFFKSCIGFMLLNCLNAKKKIHLSLHKQPSVFNTTYTIQTHVNCLTVSVRKLSRGIKLVVFHVDCIETPNRLSHLLNDNPIGHKYFNH